MKEANEIIPLIYGVLKGLEAYRSAFNKLNPKEQGEINLDELIKKYKQIEQFLSFLAKLMG